MGFQISAEIEGEAQLAAELGISADKVQDFEAPLARIGGELLKSFQLNFASRGALFQGGWKARKQDRPWPLLEKTGRMRNSFRSTQAKDSVVLDNPTPYFAYHQSKQHRARLPRRVMMMVDQDRRDFIIKSFQRHIVEALRG